MSWKTRLALPVGLAGAFVVTLTADASAAEDGFFRTRVAPVLERKCVSCHGAGGTAKGGLSLLDAGALARGGKTGPAVVPGNPEESPLLDLVVGSPPEMPKKGDPLTAAEVADLREWVTRGASWPAGLTLRDRRFEGSTWWAFTPLNRPAVPAVRPGEVARNPVDAFVLDSLNRHGLKPSPEADRRTLIRRLSFDLLGLPPTPAEVEAFSADARPDAYERLADRLLASPRYGERWGRHWLDVAHYGDTHGYDKDKRRDHAWPYRDYVIRALNADMPYARFVRQQVAGDVLEPGTADGVVATGFLAAGPWDFVGNVELREGTVDKAKTRLLDRDDMVSAAMSTFQSMTAHCARCHDHKFDPIPQADYYRLQAVFAGLSRGDRPFPTPELARLEGVKAAALARLKAIREQVTPPDSARLTDLRERADALQKADDARRGRKGSSSTNGYHSAVHPEADADAWVQIDLGRSIPVDEVRLVPARPTDFADTPGFGFPARFRVSVSDDPAFPDASTRVVEAAGRAPGDGGTHVVRPAGARGRYVRVSASTLWPRTNDYVFALAELEVISAGSNAARGRPVTSLDSIEAGRWSRAALVDGFDSRAPLDDGPETHALAGLRFELQQAALEQTRRAEAAIPPPLKAERAALTATLDDAETRLKARDGAVVYTALPGPPRPIHVLNRGEVEQPGELIGPGALSCLTGVEYRVSDAAGEGPRRAALADWLASEANVLTWRSAVNRVWHHHFGRGIVDTPNDFGRNGSKPSHPELLDWLAAGFRDGGGSFKSLHRLIVTSATYRQSSQGSPAGESLDADNRHLWRQNRRRLDAESLRDAVLSVTGTLDPRMGGPGFDLFRFKDDHSPIYDHSAPGVADNPSVRRRTVYRFTVRSVPNPFLDCMDSADPNLNVPVRTTTITALQALALWNDRFILSQSREFARRLEGQGGTVANQIDAAYRLAFGRRANDTERSALVGYERKHGLVGACRLLLNTNEFLFID